MGDLQAMASAVSSGLPELAIRPAAATARSVAEPPSVTAVAGEDVAARTAADIRAGVAGAALATVSVVCAAISLALVWLLLRP